MRVQVNSDDNVAIQEDFANQVIATVTGALTRFHGDITRIEIHLGDVNAAKGGAADKRCAVEARIAGLRPIAVSHHADTIERAVEGATGKLQRALTTAVDKLRRH